MDRKGLAAAMGTILVWSSGFAGIRAGLGAFTPGHLVLVRFTVASLTMLAYVLVARVPLPPRRLWPRLALVGVVGITLYMLPLTYGEQVVPAGTAGFIVASSPVFTAILAALLLREPIVRRAAVGIAVGLVGEGLIAFAGGHVGTVGPSVALVVLSAVATALFFVLEKPLLAEYPATHVTAWVTWAGTIPFLVFVPGAWSQVAAAPAGTLLAVIYLGIMPAAVGYVAWAYAMSRIPTDRVMSFLYLNPLLASAIAWVWLGERPGWNTLFGGLVVVLGVVVVNSARVSRASQTAAVPVDANGAASPLA